MTQYSRKDSDPDLQAFTSYAHRLSHDVRTPLGHIIGFAELLLMDEQPDLVRKDYIRAILEGGMSLRSAILHHIHAFENPSLP